MNRTRILLVLGRPAYACPLLTTPSLRGWHRAARGSRVPLALHGCLGSSLRFSQRTSTCWGPRAVPMMYVNGKIMNSARLSFQKPCSDHVMALFEHPPGSCSASALPYPTLPHTLSASLSHGHPALLNHQVPNLRNLGSLLPSWVVLLFSQLRLGFLPFPHLKNLVIYAPP